MPFGQLVIGPPGSGKTTYCNGMQQFMQAAGRKVAIINLDPANDLLPYTPSVDIADLVALEEVMEELKLGPNGGLVYCIDYLEKNLDWLKEQLAPLEKEGYYFLFDCPGQVELFMMHDSLRAVINALVGGMAYRLTAVHLVDAHLCTDATKFISALMLSLSSMLHLEMPHVNVLSKIDLVKHYGKLAFNLDYFTEVQDLSHLLQTLNSGNDAFSRRNRKLSKGLCELVEDFGLVSFMPLAIQDKASVQRLLVQVDKANGHVYAAMSSASHDPYPPEMMYGSAAHGTDRDMWMSYQEMYLEQEVTERDMSGAGAGLANAAMGSGLGPPLHIDGKSSSGFSRIQRQPHAEVHTAAAAASEAKSGPATASIHPVANNSGSRHTDHDLEFSTLPGASATGATGAGNVQASSGLSEVVGNERDQELAGSLGTAGDRRHLHGDGSAAGCSTDSATALSVRAIDADLSPNVQAAGPDDQKPPKLTALGGVCRKGKSKASGMKAGFFG